MKVILNSDEIKAAIERYVRENVYPDHNVELEVINTYDMYDTVVPCDVDENKLSISIELDVRKLPSTRPAPCPPSY